MNNNLRDDERFNSKPLYSEYQEADEEEKSIKDYLLLIKKNIITFSIIAVVITAGAVYYALNQVDIYTTTTTLKINKSQGSILRSPLIPEFEDYGSDRLIANEIEILKSNKLRMRIAQSLVDSFYNAGNKDKFYIIRAKDDNGKLINEILPPRNLAAILLNDVTIEQKKGLDIISIETSSPSPEEAALIGNVYANEYKNLNLEVNRNQLTFVKNFLNEQKLEKQKELRQAEDTLKNFQEKGGVIALSEQASALISELSNFEAQKNAAQIELMASDEVLLQYKEELKKQDPGLADYLESVTSEAYITALQQQLAALQINKDMALANKKSKIDISEKIKEYDRKIDELNARLNDKINVIKAGIFASSPAQVKELSQKIIEEEVKNRSLEIKIKGLASVVNKYEERFNKLPKTSIDLARFQRNRESLEKLYTLVEEKYQEALINEQSQPGNVFIVDEAVVPLEPSRPNRKFIILIGLAAGLAAAFGFVYMKDYFDHTVKSPDDIEKRNIGFLGWVPKMANGMLGGSEHSVIISEKHPDSIQSEAFRTIRTRIQFSKVKQDSLKIILVTSPAPQEGKTFVSLNLAHSFAQANKKTIIIDCDLRKPKIHTAFGVNKSPGLTEYLFGSAPLDKVIHKSGDENLYYITSGTIPPNPAEMLVSDEMKNFINDLRSKYDYVVIDSPPIIAVTDSEILSRIVDGTILVVSAESTDKEMMARAAELIQYSDSYFLGTILNNFSYKNGYGKYYRYYYYYSENGTGKGKRKHSTKA